jgi:O-antigen ligase
MKAAFVPAVSTEAADREQWTLRLPRITLTFVFIFASCFSAWIPFAINLGGLNLRVSQIFLPLVFLWLLTHKATWRIARSNLPLAVAGFVLWGAFLFWTAVNFASYESLVKPLGRVFLLGLNLLHLVAVYWLVVRTQQWRGAVSALLVSVTFFNALLVIVTFGAGLGIPFFQGMLVETRQPVLVGGELVSAEVVRFTFSGIQGGVMAAMVLTIVAVFLLTSQSKPAWWLWLVGVINAAVLMVGFSRQNVVSLVGGLGVIGFYLLLRKRLQRLIRLALLISVIIITGFWLISQLPGGQGFYQAFMGRTLQLFQPEAYTTGTVQGRVRMWSGMWEDIARNPFWGNGQDAYLKYANPGEEGSHNFPLEVLHTAGIAGLIAYGGLHLLIAITGWRSLFRKNVREADRWLLLGLLAAYAALWLSSLTNLIFTTSTYWVVMALVLAGARLLSAPVSQPNVGPRQKA